MKDKRWIIKQINLLWQEVKKTNSTEKALSDLRKIIVLMEVLEQKLLIPETISNETDLINQVAKKIKKEIPDLKKFRG